MVKLCDPFVARGPYLSALEMYVYVIKCYTHSPSFTFTLLYGTLLLTAIIRFKLRFVSFLLNNDDDDDDDDDEFRYINTKILFPEPISEILTATTNDFTSVSLLEHWLQ